MATTMRVLIGSNGKIDSKGNDTNLAQRTELLRPSQRRFFDELKGSSMRSGREFEVSAHMKDFFEKLKTSCPLGC